MPSNRRFIFKKPFGSRCLVSNRIAFHYRQVVKTGHSLYIVRYRAWEKRSLCVGINFSAPGQLILGKGYAESFFQLACGCINVNRKAVR